jgi:hypothetical protein
VLDGERGKEGCVVAQEGGSLSTNLHTCMPESVQFVGCCATTIPISAKAMKRMGEIAIPLSVRGG